MGRGPRIRPSYRNNRLPHAGSVAGMPWTEPVTVTLPGEQVAIIKARVAKGRTRSVSAWIAAAVGEQLADRGLTSSEHRQSG